MAAQALTIDSRREVDPVQPKAPVTVRDAEGNAPYNGHFWAGDCRHLFICRYLDRTLFIGAVELENGAWLSGSCVHARDTQYPTRRAAVARDIRRMVRELRRDRRPRPGTLGNSRSVLTREAEALARRWLYQVAAEEFGPRRRWRRLKAYWFAVALEERARRELETLEIYVRSEQQRLSGPSPWPSKNKKAWDSYEALERRNEPVARARYADQSLRAMMRLSHRMLRTDSLRPYA
jgi:hypothetical protein